MGNQLELTNEQIILLRESSGRTSKICIDAIMKEIASEDLNKIFNADTGADSLINFITNTNAIVMMSLTHFMTDFTSITKEQVVQIYQSKLKTILEADFSEINKKVSLN